MLHQRTHKDFENFFFLHPEFVLVFAVLVSNYFFNSLYYYCKWKFQIPIFRDNIGLRIERSWHACSSIYGLLSFFHLDSERPLLISDGMDLWNRVFATRNQYKKWVECQLNLYICSMLIKAISKNLKPDFWKNWSITI